MVAGDVCAMSYVLFGVQHVASPVGSLGARYSERGAVAMTSVLLCEARRSKGAKVSEEGIEPPILSVLSSRPNH